MAATALPQHPGELSPAEATAFMAGAISGANLAGDREVAARTIAHVEEILYESRERMLPLKARWRATNYMLTGNTLDRGGPADVHVPEIAKAMDTLVPRLEERVVAADPWFRVVSRKEVDRKEAMALEAYIDWQFDQARVRELIQPCIRDMLVTQAGVFYVWWDVDKRRRRIPKVTKSWKNGDLRRSIAYEDKEIVKHYGPRAKLVDPFDFIIDTQATNPQDALYVGHRAYLTVDDLKRLGRVQGWMNLDELETLGTETAYAFGPEEDRFKWPRDPTSRRGEGHLRHRRIKGLPNRIETVFLFSRFAKDDGRPHEDYRIVVAAGRVVLEVRRNPYNDDLRPYATVRSANNGHEFYGIGQFDNAVRLNQHLDRLHAILLRGAEVGMFPMTFVEEDADMPDSLYQVRPFQVFKGVGPVRFQSISDGAMRSGPMLIQMLQRNIEETVAAFRLQMGQDLSGGTATEATLGLQEGNRRTSGLVRGIGSGLEQLLDIFYAFNQQFSMEDIEFPVLGKRGLDMRKGWTSIGPEQFMHDIKFDLIGLRTQRNFGMRATGIQAWSTAMAPFAMANAQNVDQIYLMHTAAKEWIGEEEADKIVRLPTPLENLRSQEEENEVLMAGEEVEVDPDDDDQEHIEKMRPLYMRATLTEGEESRAGMKSLPSEVRRVVIEHYMSHVYQRQRKEAQERVRQQRMPQQMDLPPEAGGTPSADGGGRKSPSAGGFSDAITQLSQEPGGQTPRENPGPADPAKYPRTGGSRRTTNQTENRL